MNRAISNRVIILMFCLGMALSGCSGKNSSAQWCLKDSAGLKPSKMMILFDRGLMVSEDASSGFTPVKSERVVGFLDPFPFLLPKQGIPAGQFFLDGFDVEVSKGVADNGWTIIRAHPASAISGKPFHTGTVIYSPVEGVVALETGDFFDGKNFSTHRYYCGSRPLTTEAVAKSLAIVR